MNSKKKKITTSVIAVVLVAALALAGTFAWSSDDSSDGEEEGTNTPNVKLHDDYDKTNISALTDGTKYRKIYAENTGTVNLYVRVKLSEYMSKGNRTLLPNTSKANKSSWKPRYNDDGLEFSGTEIDKYISLDTGKGKTTDYIKDRKNNYSDGTDAVADEKVTPSTPALEIGTTPAGQVMTMNEWNKLSTAPTAGCWVLDTDGYAYWSQKLPADKATSLLLNTLTINDIDESYYYGLSVNMEAVTESDVEHWINGTKLSGQDKVPSQASKDAAAILKGLSNEYVKITSEMKSTTPSANTYDDDGDGYLSKEQNKKYEKAVAEVTAAVTAINGATVDDATKDVVTIDGVEWRVLSKTADQAELITKDAVTRIKYAKEGVTTYPKWSGSAVREYLNIDYYAGLSDGLKAIIKEETLKTPKAFDALADLEETQDKVYLLAEGITLGAFDKTVVTPGGKVLAGGAAQLKCATTTLDGQAMAWWWLRTPRADQNRAGRVVAATGIPNTAIVSSRDGVRAAITVRLK